MMANEMMVRVGLAYFGAIVIVAAVSMLFS